MKKTVFFLIIFFVTIVILVVVRKTSVKHDTEVVQWNSSNESITLPFSVGKSGHLFFKGRMNGINGFFLFDTGAENSFLNEKYITGNDLKLDSCSIIDAQNIRQTKNLYKIRDFELGAIKIKDLIVFPADTLMWQDPKGAFYGQDSVIGVIGTNIISKFIWDFDMINKQVTVSNSSSYCDSLPDSSVVKLISVEKHKEILLWINGKPKRLTLDFGSSNPVSLCSSIPNKEMSEDKVNYSIWKKSGLNHLAPKEGKESNFNFADVKFGAYEFKEIQCYENDDSALLGIPFVWSFKRVIIDFINGKAYFIQLNESAGDFAVKRFSRPYVYNSNGVTIYDSRPKGYILEIGNSFGKFKFEGFGKVMIYSKNGDVGSIFCQDSIRLPDGKIKLGPVTVNVDSIMKSIKIN